jgi:hypothetical protein
MTEEPIKREELSRQQREIELLARETEMPIDLVKKIYTIEHAKLDQGARIKTYVPVLIYRHVKALLQIQRAAS